jgi:hypothetical protein
MEQLHEIYIGPGETGSLDIKKIKEVLSKHKIAFAIKEQSLMRWGDETLPGLIIQLEATQENINTLLGSLREASKTELVGDYSPGDLED